jgi:hypothetical protein
MDKPKRSGLRLDAGGGCQAARPSSVAALPGTGQGERRHDREVGARGEEPESPLP